ncbi:hypothetical protein CCR94_06205 [Rhodoblastus sphagnicola]|uniref:Uncharacterized protein n=1 Tax=Rhodoblastus sphagnicola TaxID=333368 RepID=A0A2S6NCD4_9HYPH|nr:hypothetical protein [Rhodoblastus sphagnicola]MBB4196795.1 hypothetical protein [Rhodoblastus sphagnicola]PPQ32241.1 hypothetical protein CCR94_06205 [Rhodoblastus sphagnicola]
MTIAIEPYSAPKATVLPSLAFYVLAASIGLALFVGAFAADLFSADEVLFFRGLKLIALAAMLQFLFTFPLRHLLNRRCGGQISIHHQIATVSLAIGLNMTFLIVVPVTLDRSVSVFLLGVMNERPTETFTADRLETVFDDVYVRKYGAMDRRIKEQLRSGNIAPSGEGFIITPVGRAFIRFSNAVATLFHLNRRYINPELETVAASN